MESHLVDVPLPSRFAHNIMLAGLLGMKNDAGYGDRSLGKKDAAKAVTDAERLLSYVKARMI